MVVQLHSSLREFVTLCKRMKFRMNKKWSYGDRERNGCTSDESCDYCCSCENEISQFEMKFRVAEGLKTFCIFRHRWDVMSVSWSVKREYIVYSI